MSLLGPLPEFLQHDARDHDARDLVPIVTPTGDRMRLVCNYALGRQVLADKRFSRSEAVKPDAPRLNDAQPAPNSIMSMDGTEHARLRRIVAGTFTSGRVAAMAPFIERLTDMHIDTIAASGPGADLMEGLARPLPLAVICSLLGIPHEDGDRFRNWVEVLFDLSASSLRDKARHRLELVTYMTKLIGRKRTRHGEDLLSAMIRAHDQGALSVEELVTMGLALLMAGYETTVGQIGLSVLFLLTHGPAWDQLRDRPDLLEPAIEELLRLTPATPVSFPRVATQNVPLGATTIHAGEAVVVSLLDANRDPKAFSDPEHWEPGGRDAVHLTFGHGVHRCPGAPLARLQTKLVLSGLLRRFPGLRISGGPEAVLWKDGLGTRGLSQLLIEW